MNDISRWVISVFRKRIDKLAQRIHVNPKHQAEWKATSELFEKLKGTFSAEQLKLFIEWEEHMSYQVSKEKEELYLRGILDGFQLYATLDEMSGFIGIDEDGLNTDRPRE